MGKNTGIIVGILAIVVVGGVVYASSMQRKEAATMESEKMEKAMMEEKAIQEKKMMEEKTTMENKETMIKDDSMKNDSMIKKDEEGAMMQKDESMMKAGSYEAYAPEKVAMASAEHDVVLFFRASWCPTCKAVDADIKANLGNIPSGLSILDVDYDAATALKQKYGVTYQHTFVQVDANGKLVKKWSGSPTLAALVKEVQ